MPRRSRFISLLVLAFILFPLLATGCSSKDTHDTVQRSDFPTYLKDASPRVAEAYDFAVTHPDDLAHQPCYCGCGSMGHTSNLSCFVKEFEADGAAVYDSHAAGCGICVDIAQDVIRLKDEGKSSLAIRQYVDATYSTFGPSTDTPLPQG